MTTNEEWLKSLPTEELAIHLDLQTTCHASICNGQTCMECAIAWLKQERAIDDRD